MEQLRPSDASSSAETPQQPGLLEGAEIVDTDVVSRWAYWAAQSDIWLTCSGGVLNGLSSQQAQQSSTSAMGGQPSW